MNNSTLQVSHDETPLGAGYWAMRHTRAQSGVVYSKLVKRDRSKPSTMRALYTLPQVGRRPRIKHRARTCAKLNRGE